MSKIRDYDRTCAYITKYITKQAFKVKKGQPVYFSSRGLKTPLKKEFTPYKDLTYLRLGFCKF